MYMLTTRLRDKTQVVLAGSTTNVWDDCLQVFGGSGGGAFTILGGNEDVPRKRVPFGKIFP